MKNAIVILLILSGTISAKAQQLAVGDLSTYPKDMVSYTVTGGDTTVNITTYTCLVVAQRSFASARQQALWSKLKTDVKTAYPYAILAKMKLAELDSQLKYIKGDAARKNFVEEAEKELVKQFEDDMRNLTFTQGRILIKLIDRETNSTTYQIIKERRGSFSAFMWQSVAFVFGNNLKADYDPTGADANIEAVVELIELGLL